MTPEISGGHQFQQPFGAEVRIEGTLSKWHDERGFGFIAPRLGGQEVFAHVSAFPRDGRRPRIGETLWFDIEVDPRGRKRAVRIERPARAISPQEARRVRDGSPRTRGLVRGLVTAAIVVGLGVYGYGEMSRRSVARLEADDSEPARGAAVPPTASASAAFRCDGRTYCSQMTSCAEATYFLRNCPGTKMDGDGDGVPCEQQWCTGPFSR